MCHFKILLVAEFPGNQEASLVATVERCLQGYAKKL